MTSTLNRVEKPKTRKGKIFLEKREAQLVELSKNTMFVKGQTCSDYLNKVMKDLHLLKKPNSVYLSKKNDFRPMEDPTPIEFLAKKNAAPLFAFGSHNKKRPNNLILGRTYDDVVMDLVELGVENYKPMSSFKNEKTSLGSKPVVHFSGEAFETQFDYGRLKNLFLDFFQGPKIDNVRLNGIESVISIVAHEGVIRFRNYRIHLKKSGTRLPRVELEEMGPRFDMRMRRNEFASEDLFKRSLKQPKELKPKKTKNIDKSALGTTFGRVHMERQDYGRLSTRSMKGLKNKAAKVAAQNFTAPQAVGSFAATMKRSDSSNNEGPGNKRVKFNATEKSD
jgi:ribosome production factor 2